MKRCKNCAHWDDSEKMIRNRDKARLGYCQVRHLFADGLDSQMWPAYVEHFGCIYWKSSKCT